MQILLKANLIFYPESWMDLKKETWKENLNSCFENLKMVRFDYVNTHEVKVEVEKSCPT